MHVYTFMICIGGAATCMCLCVPLAVSSLARYWVNIYVDIVSAVQTSNRHRCIYVLVYMLQYQYIFLHIILKSWLLCNSVMLFDDPVSPGCVHLFILFVYVSYCIGTAYVLNHLILCDDMLVYMCLVDELCIDGDDG